MYRVYFNATTCQATITTDEDPNLGIVIGTFDERPLGNPAFLVHALLRKRSILPDRGISVVVDPPAR